MKITISTGTIKKCTNSKDINKDDYVKSIKK